MSFFQRPPVRSHVTDDGDDDDDDVEIDEQGLAAKDYLMAHNDDEADSSGIATPAKAAIQLAGGKHSRTNDFDMNDNGQPLH